MAMPTFVGAINSIVVSSITRAWPAGHTTNDVAFFIGYNEKVFGDSYARPTDLTGWTSIPLASISNDAAVASVDMNAKAWWYRLPGPSQPNLGIVNVGANPGCYVFVIRGLPTSGNPYSAVATKAENTSTTAISFPTLTTTAVDNLILNLHISYFASGTAQFSGYTNASLANVTQRAASAQGSRLQIGAVTGEKAVAGSIGTGTATLANANKQLQIVIAAGEPSYVEEKYFFGTSGTTYLLTGTKLLDLKRGRAYRVKNMTNLIVILDDGRVFRKINDNVLVDN